MLLLQFEPKVLWSMQRCHSSRENLRPFRAISDALKGGFGTDTRPADQGAYPRWNRACRPLTTFQVSSREQAARTAAAADRCACSGHGRGVAGIELGGGTREAPAIELEAGTRATSASAWPRRAIAVDPFNDLREGGRCFGWCQARWSMLWLVPRSDTTERLRRYRLRRRGERPVRLDDPPPHAVVETINLGAIPAQFAASRRLTHEVERKNCHGSLVLHGGVQ